MIKDSTHFLYAIKKHTGIIILSLLFILVFVVQCVFVAMLKDFVPEAVSFKYKSTAGISPLSLEAVDNSSGITQKSASLTSLINSEPVQLMLTNSDYSVISNMTFTDGAYFKMTDESLTNRFAVIGEELSVLLFKSNKAVGQRITINDIPFTVCGVYKQDKNVFKQISYGVDPLVYIPIISDFGSDIEQVITLSNAEITSSTVSTMQLQLLQPFSYDYAINLSSVRHMASQTIHLSLFICGLMLILWLIVKGYKQLKEKSYQNKRTLFVTIGIFLTAIIIFLLIKFKLYIPFSWFPEDNIFDFKSYFEQLISVFQNRTTYSHSLDVFWNYSFTLLPVCFLLGIISIITFIPIFIKAIPLLNTAIEKLKGK